MEPGAVSSWKHQKFLELVLHYIKYAALYKDIESIVA
jgi:hypothetical protein